MFYRGNMLAKMDDRNFLCVRLVTRGSSLAVGPLHAGQTAKAKSFVVFLAVVVACGFGGAVEEEILDEERGTKVGALRGPPLPRTGCGVPKVCGETVASPTRVCLSLSLSLSLPLAPPPCWRRLGEEAPL